MTVPSKAPTKAKAKTSKAKIKTKTPKVKAEQRLRDLKGFGPKSEEILAEVGIHSVAEFMAIDPYDLYAELKQAGEEGRGKRIGLNSIYAIIGAQQDMPWLEVAQSRKMEILMQLDDRGLAPE